jgi:WD40 repeat protein
MSIKIWDSTDGSLKLDTLAHSNTVSALTLLNGDNFASGSYDRLIKIWTRVN